jgi:hypothetical protein
VSDDPILTEAQRRELLAFADTAKPAMDDAELLGAAAEQIGLSGEMAVDTDGVLELERGDVMVVLESVAEEDVALVERPDLLHLGIYLRADSADRRTALEEAGLIDPPDTDETGSDTPDEAGWALAWWGALCTRLPREAALPLRMQTLHQVMNEAEAVLERGEVGPFFDRLSDVILEDE